MKSLNFTLTMFLQKNGKDLLKIAGSVDLTFAICNCKFLTVFVFFIEASIFMNILVVLF